MSRTKFIKCLVGYKSEFCALQTFIKASKDFWLLNETLGIGVCIKRDDMFLRHTKEFKEFSERYSFKNAKIHS